MTYSEAKQVKRGDTVSIIGTVGGKGVEGEVATVTSISVFKATKLVEFNVRTMGPNPTDLTLSHEEVE